MTGAIFAFSVSVYIYYVGNIRGYMMRNLKNRVVTFVGIIFLVTVSNSYGRSVSDNSGLPVHLDQLIYSGMVLGVSDQSIRVKIFGPSCVGERVFKMDTSQLVGANEIGSHIFFVLSGKCSSEKSTITVKRRGLAND